MAIKRATTTRTTRIETGVEPGSQVVLYYDGAGLLHAVVDLPERDDATGAELGRIHRRRDLAAWNRRTALGGLLAELREYVLADLYP